LRSVIQKVRKYFDAPGDVVTFFRIPVCIVRIPVLTRRYGLEELIKKLTPRRENGGVNREKIIVYANWWLNRKVAMFRPTCFKRSLILYRFLRENGAPVRIHYGIKKTPEKGQEGHSWVSLDGVSLPPDGESAHEYRQTFVYPPEDAS